MKFTKQHKGFTPTPILKKISWLLTNLNFLPLFNYKTKEPAGIGVSLHGKRGFTLIEMVIVIGIMGALSAIIYSSFDASRARSRDQKRVSDISAIQISLEQYFQKYGIYPLTLNTLVPTFMPSIPTDPSTNADYSANYFPLTKISGTNCISYQLWTRFEKINSYLESRKGFDSTATVLPNGMIECGSGHNSAKVNAFTDTLIYDAMPY